MIRTVQIRRRAGQRAVDDDGGADDRLSARVHDDTLYGYRALSQDRQGDKQPQDRGQQPLEQQMMFGYHSVR